MVRPLTKRTKKGVLYVRPQAVETAIRAALREDWATLRRRLEITDSRSPEHLSSECLVHLFPSLPTYVRHGARKELE